MYDAQAAALIKYYNERRILKSVQGVGNVDEIFKNVCEVLKSKS